MILKGCTYDGGDERTKKGAGLHHYHADSDFEVRGCGVCIQNICARIEFIHTFALHVLETAREGVNHQHRDDQNKPS
jgi:hypothetical protein